MMLITAVMRKRGYVVLIVALIALILLPTGTPEDLVTTVPLFLWFWASFGLEAAITIYTLISIALIVILWRLHLL